MALLLSSSKSKMFYYQEPWYCVACNFKSHYYINHRPEYPDTRCEATVGTLSDANYAAFLEECDITGTRKAYNRKLFREAVKRKIYLHKDLGFWTYWLGEEYANNIVDKYMLKHGLLGENNYPVWRKPVIKIIPSETIRWKFNYKYRSWECLDELLLHTIAKSCDILLLGRPNDIKSLFCVTANWDAKPDTHDIDDTPETEMKAHPFRAIPSEEYVQKHPNWRDMDPEKDFDDFKPAYCHTERHIYVNDLFDKTSICYNKTKSNDLFTMNFKDLISVSKVIPRNASYPDPELKKANLRSHKEISFFLRSKKMVILRD